MIDSTAREAAQTRLRGVSLGPSRRATGAGPNVPRHWLADRVTAGRSIPLFCKNPRSGHMWLEFSNQSGGEW